MSWTQPHRIALPTGVATYLTAGPPDGPTVLLLHGGGLDCASLSWRRLAPVLATSHRVIAPNWPGYAGSDAFGAPYAIPDLGRWLVAFLDRLEVERAALVGVSMGGGAALWTAIHHGDRVAALAPVATYGVADRAPWHLLSYLLTRLPLNRASFALLRRSPWLLRRALASIFADPKKLTPDLVAEVRDALDAAGDGAAFTHFQRGEMGVLRLRSSFVSDLAHVTQPTLFIHGRADALVPLRDVEAAARSMPNGRLEVMDAGHWPMREEPDVFNRLAASFLDDFGR